VAAAVSSAATEPIELALVALRRAARAPISTENRGEHVRWRRRRAVVDEAFGGDRRSDPFVDQAHHLHDALALTDSSFHLIADTHR